MCSLFQESPFPSDYSWLVMIWLPPWETSTRSSRCVTTWTWCWSTRRSGATSNNRWRTMIIQGKTNWCANHLSSESSVGEHANWWKLKPEGGGNKFECQLEFKVNSRRSAWDNNTTIMFRMQCITYNSKCLIEINSNWGNSLPISKFPLAMNAV